MFGAEVKVNGKVAGTFRSSFNRNTLEVTELLKAAGEENALEVATLMQPKGGAFDTNDDWTFHGIYRSVMLDVRPAVYLKDWTVAVKDGKVTVKTEVAGDGSVEHNLPVTVAGSRLWSAENPVRHDVLFTVRDAKGRVTETVKAKVGLREVTWSGRELKVNGKRVWLDGVNHHDICPCHGRAITDEEQWRDVKMIKDAGMNFIRCCHYPPSTALLDACDALGVYVLDEVPFGFGDKLLYDESYGEVLEERVRLTIARDKNRASVVIWAIGNENPVTRITIAAGRLAGELDPTRPWTFPMIPGAFKAWVTGTDKFAPGNGDIPPVYDWHYPNDGDIPEYMDKVDRPVIASEWGARRRTAASANGAKAPGRTLGRFGIRTVSPVPMDLSIPTGRRRRDGIRYARCSAAKARTAASTPMAGSSVSQRSIPRSRPHSPSASTAA